MHFSGKKMKFYLDERSLAFEKIFLDSVITLILDIIVCGCVLIEKKVP